MQSEQVRRIRSFNRLVTRSAGALDQSYLRRGRPLGEARVIFEVGAAGSDTLALRERLRLDSGCLSRPLRSVRSQGLVEVRRQVADEPHPPWPSLQRVQNCRSGGLAGTVEQLQSVEPQL